MALNAATKELFQQLNPLDQMSMLEYREKGKRLSTPFAEEPADILSEKLILLYLIVNKNPQIVQN
jgi:hypothetical protein